MFAHYALHYTTWWKEGRRRKREEVEMKKRVWSEVLRIASCLHHLLLVLPLPSLPLHLSLLLNERERERERERSNYEVWLLVP